MMEFKNVKESFAGLLEDRFDSCFSSIKAYADPTSEKTQNFLFTAKNCLFNYTQQKTELRNFLIQQLTDFDELLDAKIPDWIFQRVMNRLGQSYQFTENVAGEALCDLFEISPSFKEWLQTNEGTEWYQQLAIFLAKLPLKAGYNIISLIKKAIATACYTAVHPLKSSTELAITLVRLIDELSQPKNWSRIGAGMIGASLGQTVITGNLVSLIGAAVGGVLLMSGFCIDSLIAAIETEEGLRLSAVKERLRGQITTLPEAMLTGFFMGLLIGKIRQTVHENNTQGWAISNDKEAQQYADQFIKENNLPQYTSCHLTPWGTITIQWDHKDLFDLTPFKTYQYNMAVDYTTKINLRPWHAKGFVDYCTKPHPYHTGTHVAPKWALKDVLKNPEGYNYPFPTDSVAMNNLASMASPLQDSLKIEN